MAKVAFTKLGLTKNISTEILHWNGNEIEVKQYLPISEKLELIGNILNNCQDENNFINFAKLDVFFDLEVIYKYTNINFTEKQKEDSFKLYDLLESSGFFAAAREKLPEEVEKVREWLYSIAKNIYEYRNSIYGILDAVSNDYSNLELDADQLKNKIADPDSLGLLKNVLTKLG